MRLGVSDAFAFPLIRVRKIKVNQAKSSQIKVNQAILKHFFYGKSSLTGWPMAGRTPATTAPKTLVPQRFRWNRNAASVAWILASTPPLP
jgi:hypothetical protein